MNDDRTVPPASSGKHKGALLDVAAMEFAASGFDRASVQKIASAAGVSKAKIFYYFGTKEDLYSQALDRTLEPLLRPLEQVRPAASAEAFWASLDAGLEHAYAFNERDPLGAMLLRRLYERQGEAPSFLRLLSRIRAAVDAWLRDGRRLGAVRTDLPVGVLAEAALGALVHMDRWLASNTESPRLAEDLLRGTSIADLARDALQQRTPQEREVEVSYATERVSRETNAYIEASDVVTRPVTMRDARRLDPLPNLDREGFELIEAPAEFDVPPTDSEARAAYGVIEDVLRQRTGATFARVFDHTVRHTEQTPGRRPPIRVVHADYGPRAGLRRLRQLLAPGESARWADSRVVVVNLWQSVAGVVHSTPLGFVDITSVRDEDFIPVKVKYSDRTGEIGYYRPNEGHRWYWFPFLRPSEALLFKTFEGQPDGQHWSCPHAAFNAPDSPAELMGRRTSIEFRILLGFDALGGGEP